MDGDPGDRPTPLVHGFAPGGEGELVAELHAVLLGLAGRLPDADLAQLRAVIIDELRYLPDAIVIASVEQGVPLTPSEVDALAHVARGLGVSGVTDRIARVPLTGAFTSWGNRFLPPPATGLDYTDVALASDLSVRRGVNRVWRAWRDDAPGPRRVFLVEVDPGTDAGYLAVAGQRRLVELGELVPAVEVFWSGQALPPYHLAALARAEPLWSR